MSGIFRFTEIRDIAIIHRRFEKDIVAESIKSIFFIIVIRLIVLVVHIFEGTEIAWHVLEYFIRRERLTHRIIFDLIFNH